MHRRAWMLTAALAISVLCAAPSAWAKSRTDSIAITGWKCGGCAARTVRLVKETSGVIDAKADLKAGQMIVTYDDEKVSLDTIRKVIEKAGYGCDMPKK